MAAVLELTDITRAFGPGRGLFGVDLRIAAGEVYTLLGPNGAGKTSLVRSITGRLRLDAGRSTIGGRDPARDPAARRLLGLVPQEIALYFDLTVLENLAVLGRLAGLSATTARRQAEAALRWIDLVDRGDSLVRHLSGGQQRRVNLAAGTIHDPALLVLDEPTVGVDLEARERIHGLLADLRGRGTAILLSTHDFAEAASLADRVGILAAGRLRAEGPPAALVAAAFGSRLEADLGLAAPPDEAVRARLTAMGLWSGRDPRRWFGPVDGVAGLPALVAAAAAAGALVVASGVRPPDLASVFRRATGQDPAS